MSFFRKFSRGEINALIILGIFSLVAVGVTIISSLITSSQDIRNRAVTDPYCTKQGNFCGPGSQPCCSGLSCQESSKTCQPKTQPTQPQPTATAAQSKTQLGSCTEPCFNTAGCTCPSNCNSSTVSNYGGTCGGVKANPTATTAQSKTQLGSCTEPCFNTAGCTCPSNCNSSTVSNYGGTCGGVKTSCPSGSQSKSACEQFGDPCRQKSDGCWEPAPNPTRTPTPGSGGNVSCQTNWDCAVDHYCNADKRCVLAGSKSPTPPPTAKPTTANQPGSQCYFGASSCDLLGRKSASGCNNCPGICCGEKITQVCTPGSRSCVNSTTLSTCKADGSGFTQVTCAANHTCQGNSCVALPSVTPRPTVPIGSFDNTPGKVCEAYYGNQTGCIINGCQYDGVSGMCTQKGDSFTVCSGDLLCDRKIPGSSCSLNGKNGICTRGNAINSCSCKTEISQILLPTATPIKIIPSISPLVPTLCTPNQKSCLGNAVMSCSATGSPSSVETCRDDKICSAGSCVKAVTMADRCADIYNRTGQYPTECRQAFIDAGQTPPPFSAEALTANTVGSLLTGGIQWAQKTGALINSIGVLPADQLLIAGLYQAVDAITLGGQGAATNSVQFAQQQCANPNVSSLECLAHGFGAVVNVGLAAGDLAGTMALARPISTAANTVPTPNQINIFNLPSSTYVENGVNLAPGESLAVFIEPQYMYDELGITGISYANSNDQIVYNSIAKAVADANNTPGQPLVAVSHGQPGRFYYMGQVDNGVQLGQDIAANGLYPSCPVMLGICYAGVGVGEKNSVAANVSAQLNGNIVMGGLDTIKISTTGRLAVTGFEDGQGWAFFRNGVRIK